MGGVLVVFFSTNLAVTAMRLVEAGSRHHIVMVCDRICSSEPMEPVYYSGFRFGWFCLVFSSVVAS